MKVGRSDRFMLLPPDCEDWKREDTENCSYVVMEASQTAQNLV